MAIVMAAAMTGCEDKNLVPPGSVDYEDPALSRGTTFAAGTTSGLVQNDDGTWTATKRVPLVGMGRVLNCVSTSVASVGALDSGESDALTDLDLTNTYNPKNAVIGAEVATNQAISVKDLYHVYAPNQVVGFVLKAMESSVLTLDVLKSFWVDVRLNGETVESKVVVNSTGVLDLTVGGIAGGNAENQMVIEFTPTAGKFDEVRLGYSGVSASVWDQLNVFYAYVGENPIIPAVNAGTGNTSSPLKESEAYFDNNVDYWKSESSYAKVSLKKLIDSNLSNGIEIGTISNLFQPHMAVDFGRDVPAGTEVGWYVTGGSLLSLGIGSSVKVTTFDSSGNSLENYSYTDVLNLGLVSGESNYISFVTTKPCRRIKLGFYGVKVDLGAKVVHYAWVREPAEIDESSYYSVGDVTVYNPNYKFVQPTEGSVSYSLKSKQTGSEAKVMGNGIYGMNFSGPYEVVATYTTPSGDILTYEFTVTRAINETKLCEADALVNPYVSETDKTLQKIYQLYVPDGFDGLRILGIDLEQKGTDNNLVDPDLTNYVTYTTATEITLAANKALFGIKRIDGNTINPGEKNLRVGIVVDNNSDILKADVLKFFQIKLLMGDKEVEKGVAMGAVSVSLAKINDSQTLTRLSINTNQDFDRVELYCIEPVSINLGTSFSIYYAFAEDMARDCSNPGTDCMQMIANNNFGATVGVETVGGVSVAGVVTDMGYIVDADMTTYGKIVNTVSVGTVTNVNVKFNTIHATADAPQEVGFVLNNAVDILQLIGVTEVRAYYQGTEVASNTSWGILDLELTSDKCFFPLEVDTDFDELQLVVGNGITLGEGLQVCGAYIKPDLDGDGLLDCIGDFVESSLTNLTIAEHVCLGTYPAISVLGAQTDFTYYLRFVGGVNNKDVSWPVRVNDEGYLLIKYTVNGETTDNSANYIAFMNNVENVGEYAVRLTSMQNDTDGDATVFSLHPLYTTWKGSKDTEWNDWDNWDYGVPWTCTNVIIPSPGKQSTVSMVGYPELGSGAYYCQDIHFEPGGVIKGQHKLNHLGDVYVDNTITSGDYRLVSAPLQYMYTGDMFIKSDRDWKLDGDWSNGKWNAYTTDASNNNIQLLVSGYKYFTDIEESVYPEHRVEPIIYQRFWSKMVENVGMSRASNLVSSNVLFADWSRSFNAVATRYVIGQGYAMRAGDANYPTETTTYNLHYPKLHTPYHYYSPTGTLLEQIPAEKVARGTQSKFLVDYKGWQSSIELTRMDSGDMFIFGNPLMAYIDIAQLLSANGLTTAYIYSENGSYDPVNTGTIAPMTAVFLAATSESTSFNLKLTEDMTRTTEVACKWVDSEPSSQSMRIVARKNGISSKCLVAFGGKDEYHPREDIKLLLDGDVTPQIAVFTVGEDKSLSIQHINAAKKIPLGIYVESAGSVELSFSTQNSAWQQWWLVDSLTGREYPLQGSVALDDVSTCDDRFYLVAP
ncbi:MAG: hypothetical protein LUD17_13845 [Bacteroidales bacterium]|nr:hypothetical protein [Bacteroidales bacterium]